MISLNKEQIETLVQKAKDKDKQALQDLYSAFLPYIYVLLSKIYVNGYDKDDLKQECFLTLCTCIKKYKGTDTFIAYVTASMKNNILYLLRRSKSHSELNISEIDGYTVETTEDIAIKHLDSETLSIAIKNLTPQERSILTDYYYNDLSLMTISKDKNSKYITTVKQKDRALNKIKYYFKEK